MNNPNTGYLPDIISFDGFQFDNYIDDERNILQPRMEEKGYSRISWHLGEKDSFGPLSRYAICWKDGVRFELMYG